MVFHHFLLTHKRIMQPKILQVFLFSCLRLLVDHRKHEHCLQLFFQLYSEYQSCVKPTARRNHLLLTTNPWPANTPCRYCTSLLSVASPIIIPQQKFVNFFPAHCKEISPLVCNVVTIKCNRNVSSAMTTPVKFTNPNNIVKKRALIERCGRYCVGKKPTG